MNVPHKPEGLRREPRPEEWLVFGFLGIILLGTLLLARLRVALRRLNTEGQTGQESAVYENGSLSIDYAAGCAYLSGEEIHLTPIEYRLLCLLAKNTGKVLTHHYILKEIWGSYTASDVGSLRVFMATLRKKLQAGPGDEPCIQTHIGIGYRMLRQDRAAEDAP